MRKKMTAEPAGRGKGFLADLRRNRIYLLLLAPAMNTRMWNHPAVRHNKELLESRGAYFVGPASGRLACGDIGEGRMAEVPEIIEKIKELLPLR